jgi:hypothetical protein
VPRNCEQIKVSADRTRAIFIDVENKKEILEYLRRSEKHRKKFEYIIGLVLENIRNTEVYDKEDINDKCKNVTAMKFFKNGSNDRIYCKEVRSDLGCYVVIMGILHEKKKTQKNSAREIARINAIGSYEYLPTLK